MVFLCRDLYRLYMSETSTLFYSLVIKTDYEHPLYSLEEVVYLRPAPTTYWPFIHSISEIYRNDTRVQQDILYAMPLQNYGFIDSDLSDFFSSIPAGTPFEDARQQVQEYALEQITQSIDREGPTTGLEVKDLSSYPEITTKTQKINELRQAEMELVQVGIQGSVVDLRELYLTSYGYEILSALEMRLITNLEGLEQVRNALTELGFQLKTGETAIAGVQMSDELKQAIWWIVENRGRTWREIIELENE